MCVAVSATPTAGAAQGGTDVKVNGDAPGSVQNEVVVALSLVAMNNMVIAFNDKVGTASPSPLGVATSMDGGVSWVDQQLSIPPDPFVGGGFLNVIFDPFLAWGPPNEFYAGYVATINASSPQSGLFIERSDDGGVTWSGPTTIAVDPAASGPVDPNYRFNDRPHIDTALHSFIAVCWIKDVGVGLPTSDGYFASSNAPAGPINQPPFPPTNLVFSTPVIFNDTPGGTDMVSAPHVATHPIGTTYVAWIDVNVQSSDPLSGTIKLDQTNIFVAVPVFGVDTTVAVIDPVPRNVSTSAGLWDGARAGSYPVIAVDENDATGLTVYMAYAADPAGPDEGDIFFIKTVDGGISWSAPLRLNDDVGTNDQIHPVIYQGLHTDVLIAWYDKRNSAMDNSWDVYLTRSTDGGATFSPNQFASDATFATPTNTASQPWLGEYLGLDSDGTDVLLGFTKRAPDVFGDVYFDRFPACQWPFVTYCTAGSSASGCQASISGLGTPSATLPSGFTLQASGVEGNKNGIFFFGVTGQQANTWGNGTSYQCVIPPVKRAGQQSGGGTNGACDGSFSSDLNALWTAKPAKNPGAGATVQSQLWYRDPFNTSNQTTSLSDAIEFTVCP